MTKIADPLNGVSQYSYSASTEQVTQQTDPGGQVTTFAYDTNGNLTTKTYGPTGLNIVTTYSLC